MNYREKRSAYHNCEKRIFEGVGLYDFPEIEPVDFDISGTTVIGFNYARTEKHPEGKVIHFYLDDYQFKRVWEEPTKYVQMMKRFDAVFTPDFSMYTDFPKAVQIFNHYRKQWLGAYWQENGATVIPTISWSDESSYDWCFDGIPKHAIVSISTVGGFGNGKNNNKDLWLAGYRKCLEVLQPSEIILFGKQYPEIEFDGKITCVENLNLKNKKEKGNKEKAEE